MITIDQARIAAPNFPRSQEWWTRFLPDWVTGTVHEDGTVTIEPTEPATRTEPRGPERVKAAARRRRQELGALRWLRNLPQLEPAIVEDRGEPCRCWRSPAVLHDGHCCFMGSPTRVCHAMPEDMRQPGEEIPV